VRVSVEPPPTEESGSDSQEGGDSSTGDSVKSNLPAPGVIVTLSGLLGALIFPREKVE